MKEFTRNNKHLIIAVTIYILLYVINLFIFYEQYNFDEQVRGYVSGYSFWRFIIMYGIGDYISVALIVIIGIGCVYCIYKEINSGIFKDKILRENYNKYTLKQIFKSYKKILLFGPIANILIFILGLILFGSKLNTTDLSSHITNFFENGINNPLLYVFLAMISSFLGMLFMCNIVLIFSRIVKKFPLVIISSFMCFNFICLCGEIYGKYYLYEIFKIEYLKWLSPYRLLNPFSVDYMSHNIIFGLILFIISFAIVLSIYLGKKNKEKLVLRNV